MYQRMLNKPVKSRHSFLLLGPRGTGKTTWARHALAKNHVYVNLLDGKTYRYLSADTSRIKEYLPQDKRVWIFIDEIQRIAEMLNDVHFLIEEGYKFCLTGSSARKLRRGGVNLLAGRARMYYFHPLILQEIGGDFNLSDVLRGGLLPNAYELRDNAEDTALYLESYVNSYLTEEIKQEGIVRKMDYFNKFLEVAAFSQGQPLNTTNIARECYVSRLTIDNYFEILEDLLLGSFLHPFTSRAKREVVRKPKFYFFDTGIYRHLREVGPLDKIAQTDGPALETIVLQHLRAINDYLRTNYKFYYWRTKDGVEVDFIAYKRGFPPIAIEVKCSNTIHGSDLKGLKLFKKNYPDSQCFLLTKGDISKESEITTMHIVDFLKNIPSLLGAR